MTAPSTASPTAAPGPRPPGPRRLHRAADGLALDLLLYGVSAAFAGVTAATSTLPAHRAWGSVAVVGYLVATVGVLVQLGGRSRHRSRFGPAASWWGTPGRVLLTLAAWAGASLLPLALQAVARAGGNPHRAQEEVVVIEESASRLVDHGTPYLGREAIAALPEPLLGYFPYQPGMAVFGLPRAAVDAWWTDARIFFALATAAALAAAVGGLRRIGVPPSLLVRAVQAVTVLPVCALTLATGGDDLPVLALCLLALASAARGRYTASGVAVGVAGALKLFAWPVALVLVGWALVRGRRAGLRLGLPALGLPVLALLPVFAVNAAAVAENVLWFPLGRGLVTSPAASPLPGYLVAETLPAGRAVATALLLTAGAVIGIWLLRRPPATAAAVATVCATGLLTAMLLMPATRFGYLLYPAAIAIWIPALRPVTRRAAREPAPH